MKTLIKIIDGKVTDTRVYKDHYNQWVAKTSILLDGVRRLELTV